MNFKLDIELPNELVAFKENIESSIKPHVEIEAKTESNLHLWQSKFGGFPYLPKNFHYPKDSNGQAMFLLAQINFAETPKLETFPEKGVLQFYISGGDDVYGICFEDLAKQDGFTILYFPDVLKDESKLVTDFRFLPKFDMLPLQKSCSLTFDLHYAPIPTADYQFEPKIFGQNVPQSKDEFYKICDEYQQLFSSAGHKIGGYPYFTQSDPRHSKKYKDENYILLFQMDTDGKADIMWGDSGIGNFFVLEQDLQKRDFSRVLYNWDCC
ncbi:MAG: DUF1963 domain-containing protein [Chloroflexi bacterium]|nr:DUF1963 domain-containing protein [Chloroflexota bacterium]